MECETPPDLRSLHQECVPTQDSCSTQTYYHGDKIEYQCKSGYYPTQSSSEKLCDDEGLWKPAGDTLVCKGKFVGDS